MDLALASLFGGLALANAGLGAVHGIAAPVGGRFDAPHGAACAALLPDRSCGRTSRPWSADGRRAPRSVATARSRRSSRDGPGAGAEDGVAWIEALVRRSRDPRPLALGSHGRGRAGDRRAGPRRQQHEGEPRRARRGGARPDRERVALRRRGSRAVQVRPTVAPHVPSASVRPRRSGRGPPHPAAADAHAGAGLGALARRPDGRRPARPATSARSTRRDAAGHSKARP